MDGPGRAARAPGTGEARECRNQQRTIARAMEALKEDARAHRDEEDLREMIRKNARDLQLEIVHG